MGIIGDVGTSMGNLSRAFKSIFQQNNFRDFRKSGLNLGSVILKTTFDMIGSVLTGVTHGVTYIFKNP